METDQLKLAKAVVIFGLQNNTELFNRSLPFQ